LKEPVGVMAVPAVEVSARVTTQGAAVSTNTGLAQLTRVDVVRRLTVMLKAAAVALGL